MNWLYYGAIAVLSVIILQIVLTKVKLSKEARRRLQHAATGQLLIGISYVLPLSVCKMALLGGILLVLYVYNFHNKFYKQEFGTLLRESEQDRLPGAFWFLVGTFLTALSFDFGIGRYAVLCLSYADPIAAWVGTSLKSPKILGTATLAGCFACFGTATLIGWFLLDNQWEMVVGALTCTIAESFPFGNDNLTIPFLTAAAITSLRSLFVD
mmetsp:Transcript_8461/g.12254  ORF Transcript_8461/g.12254 Transcript_8461/m.12254 type:complete len:211 (+) Transcript_8461:63-695(+)